MVMREKARALEGGLSHFWSLEVLLLLLHNFYRECSQAATSP